MSSDSESAQEQAEVKEKKTSSQSSLLRKSPLPKIDLFGQPIKFMLNGKTTHQTDFGGFASICYLISALYTFVLLFYVKIVGYQPASLIFNTQGMLDSVGYQEPTNLMQLNFTVGFVSPNLNGVPDGVPDFDASIGRFELLQVKKESGTISYSRTALESCSATDYDSLVTQSLLCVPQSDFTMDVYGDLHSNDFSSWFIQYRPCIDYTTAQDLFTQDEIKNFASSGKGLTGEELYSDSCQESADVTSFYNNYQMTLYGADTKIDSEASAYFNSSVYLSDNRKVLQQYVNGDTLNVNRVQVQENVHIIYDTDANIYGLEEIETYLAISTETSDLRETELFNGISASFIITKSKYYDTVMQQTYSDYDFLAQLGGYLLFNYIVTYVVVTIFTRQFVYENLIKQLFLVNTINLDHLVARYFAPKPKNNGSTSRTLNVTKDNTSEHPLLQQQDKSPAKKQTAPDEEPENRSRINTAQNPNKPPPKKLFTGIMQILAQGILFRQPYNHNTWKEIVRYSACCCCPTKDKNEKFFNRGKQIIQKDLEVTTYIKQFAKLRALSNSLLDRKQHMLLKYQMHRVLELKKSGNSKLKDEIKERFKTLPFADQKKEMFTLILSMFQEEDDVTEVDLALLKGLFSKKQFEEAEVQATGLKQQKQELQLNQDQYPNLRTPSINMRPHLDSPRGTINNDLNNQYQMEGFEGRRIIKRKAAHQQSIYSEPKKVIRGGMNNDPEIEFRQTAKQKIKGGFEAKKQIKIYPDSEEGDRTNKMTRARELTQIEQSAFEEAKSESEHDSIEREINKFYNEEQRKK